MSEKILIRTAEPFDVPAIGALHALVFGPGRFARSAYRVREGRRDDNKLSDFCHVAVRGNRLIAAVEIRRDWDSAFWPYARSSFFKVKERIPETLERLGLM